MADNDAYELATQIDRLMRRMNAGVAARAPLFDPERIGPIGGMILLTIADMQPVPLQRVADAMARDKAQLSRMISNLERRGLITRAPCEEDKRSLLLSLTDKGEAFVLEIKRTLSEVLGAILEPLDAHEQAQLMALLVKI
ncbi:MAG: MarR family transcriptional regulator [Pseudomonadota bacterium]